MGRTEKRDRQDRHRSEMAVMSVIFIIGFVLEVIAMAPSPTESAQPSRDRSLSFSAAANYFDDRILKAQREFFGDPAPLALDIREMPGKAGQFRLTMLASYSPYSNIALISFAIPADAMPAGNAQGFRCLRFIDQEPDPTEPDRKPDSIARLPDGTQLITCVESKYYFTDTPESLYAGLGIEFRIPGLSTAPSRLKLEYLDRQAYFGGVDTGVEELLTEPEGDPEDGPPGIFRPWLGIPGAELHIATPTYDGFDACSTAAVSKCVELPSLTTASGRPSSGDITVDIAYQERPSELSARALGQWEILLPLVLVGVMLIISRGMGTAAGKGLAATLVVAAFYSPLIISLFAPSEKVYYGICLVGLIVFFMVSSWIVRRKGGEILT